MSRMILGSLGKRFAAGGMMAGCFIFAAQSTASAQHTTLPPHCPPPAPICPPGQTPRYMEPSIAPPMDTDTPSPTPVDPGTSDAIEPTEPAPMSPTEDFADSQPALDLQAQPHRFRRPGKLKWLRPVWVDCLPVCRGLVTSSGSTPSTSRRKQSRRRRALC